MGGPELHAFLEHQLLSAPSPFSLGLAFAAVIIKVRPGFHERRGLECWRDWRISDFLVARRRNRGAFTRSYPFVGTFLIR
jgi:hypothetical protein